MSSTSAESCGVLTIAEKLTMLRKTYSALRPSRACGLGSELTGTPDHNHDGNEAMAKTVDAPVIRSNIPVLKTTGLPSCDLELLESAARSGFVDAAVNALCEAYDAESAAGLAAVLMRRLDPDAAQDLHDIFASR